MGTKLSGPRKYLSSEIVNPLKRKQREQEEAYLAEMDQATKEFNLKTFGVPYLFHPNMEFKVHHRARKQFMDKESLKQMEDKYGPQKSNREYNWGEPTYQNKVQINNLEFDVKEISDLLG